GPGQRPVGARDVAPQTGGDDLAAPTGEAVSEEPRRTPHGPTLPTTLERREANREQPGDDEGAHGRGHPDGWGEAERVLHVDPPRRPPVDRPGVDELVGQETRGPRGGRDAGASGPTPRRPTAGDHREGSSRRRGRRREG